MKKLFLLLVFISLSSEIIFCQGFFGPDQTVCEDVDHINLPCEVGTGFWTSYDLTYGDGQFEGYAPWSCPWSLDYIPGINDISNGYVEFCLVLYYDDFPFYQYDCVTYIFQKLPNVDAGVDIIIGNNEIVELNATLENYSTIQWTSSGDGNFSDNSVLNPFYTPGDQDISTGLVSLTLTADPIQPCTDIIEDVVEIIIHNSLPPISIKSLGSSSNAYSIIMTRTNQIDIDPYTNSVVFVHRNNETIFGGHSGNLRYDISQDGGVSWYTDQGPINPNSTNGINGARYPQISLFNTSGLKGNLFMNYFAPYVTSSSFNGYVNGSVLLPESTSTEIYDQINAVGEYIPGGLCNGENGTKWNFDVDQSNAHNFNILKGTWNTSVNDFTWEIKAIVEFDFNYIYDWNMSFDFQGENGWVAVLGKYNDANATNPILLGLYKTNDFGNTWIGPIEINPNAFSNIESEILNDYQATYGFDLDIGTDSNGNMHALLNVMAMDTIEIIDETIYNALFDIFSIGENFSAAKIANAQTYQKKMGIAPNENYMNSRPQVSQSVDGSKIFYFWLDSDSSLIHSSENSNPNLFGKALNINDYSYTEIYNFSENTNFAGQIFYSTISPNALQVNNLYKIPVIFTEFSPSQSLIEPVYFHYIDNICFQLNNPTISDQLTLYTGWNLVSFDVIPNPATPEAVFAPLITANSLEMVTGFQNQQGIFFDPAGLPFLNTLQNLVPGEGYWVKVTNAATLSVTGAPISPTFAINLKIGWNLVAYWPVETITPEVAFAPLISLGVLQTVTGYEQGGKFFDPNGPAFLNTLNEIKNGFGYWVKVSEDYNGFGY